MTAFLSGIFFLSLFLGQEVLGHTHEGHHTFFKEKSVSLSIGSAFNNKVGHAGLYSRLYYNVPKNICFGPDVTRFKNGEGGFYEYNFVLHYIFDTPLIGIYPVVGSNYTREVLEMEAHEGWNLVFGLGVHRNFGNFGGFAEYNQKQFAHFEHIFHIGFMYTILYCWNGIYQ